MRTLLTLTAVGGLVAVALPARSADKPDPFAKAVKSVEMAFDPAEAKPGQTVTLKVTVKLNPGYYTYPTKQADKRAAAQNMVNTFTFPDPGAVVFVGAVVDPPDPKSKAVPVFGIKEEKYYTGEVVFERKAVVNPGQKPGSATVKLKEFAVNICSDTAGCLDIKKLTPEATLKVLDGPAVPVEAKFADEVKKALGGM
jgi:hypothetical protein